MSETFLTLGGPDEQLELKLLPSLNPEHDFLLPSHWADLDDFYLQQCFILVRTSTSKRGHMASICVNEAGDILGYSTNLPVDFDPRQEWHAEALVISKAAAAGTRLAGSTIYVTFPPCKACFMLLVHAGIKRVVYPRESPSDFLHQLAAQHNMEIRDNRDVSAMQHNATLYYAALAARQSQTGSNALEMSDLQDET
jgi:tRNA(Arg) A34 adenosine deaminase TadA